MAGQLTIDTLKASTGVLATQNGMTGIAKAWVNFDGSTAPPTIRASFNVASITKNGTGDYTVNFSTAMPDANYVTVCTENRDSTTTDIGFGINTVSGQTQYSTSGVRIAANSSTGRYDRVYSLVAVFR